MFPAQGVVSRSRRISGGGRGVNLIQPGTTINQNHGSSIDRKLVTNK